MITIFILYIKLLTWDIVKRNSLFVAEYQTKTENENRSSLTSLDPKL